MVVRALGKLLNQAPKVKAKFSLARIESHWISWTRTLLKTTGISCGCFKKWAFHEMSPLFLKDFLFKKYYAEKSLHQAHGCQPLSLTYYLKIHSELYSSIERYTLVGSNFRYCNGNCLGVDGGSWKLKPNRNRLILQRRNRNVYLLLVLTNLHW